MLFNKWLVADTVDNCKYNNDAVGYCLYLKQEPADITSLFKFTQEFSIENSFTVLLAGDDFIDLKPSDSYIEKIIGLFFQPSYYLFNYQPLLFLKNRTPACSNFLERILQKGKDEGLRNILILEIQNLSSTDFTKTQHAYQVNREHINYDLIVKNWLTQYLEDKNPTEIHFLTPAIEFKSSEVFNRIASEENLFQKTEEYKIARAFYDKQKLIEEYRHELYLKTTNEKNAQLYLKIQKEQTANNLEWYHHEYEVLPLWYKRFGHIIKVIMGKRSFRSLFNDKVKKYKD